MPIYVCGRVLVYILNGTNPCKSLTHNADTHIYIAYVPAKFYRIKITIN